MENQTYHFNELEKELMLFINYSSSDKLMELVFSLSENESTKKLAHAISRKT